MKMARRKASLHCAAVAAIHLTSLPTHPPTHPLTYPPITAPHARAVSLCLLQGHENITYLQGAYEDRQAVHLVMDLCSGGELFDRCAHGMGCNI